MITFIEWSKKMNGGGAAGGSGGVAAGGAVGGSGNISGGGTPSMGGEGGSTSTGDIANNTAIPCHRHHHGGFGFGWWITNRKDKKEKRCKHGVRKDGKCRKRPL